MIDKEFREDAVRDAEQDAVLAAALAERGGDSFIVFVENPDAIVAFVKAKLAEKIAEQDAEQETAQ